MDVWIHSSSPPVLPGFGRYSQRGSDLLFLWAPNIPGLCRPAQNSNGTLYARYPARSPPATNFTPNAKSILQLRLGLSWTRKRQEPYQPWCGEPAQGVQHPQHPRTIPSTLTRLVLNTQSQSPATLRVLAASLRIPKFTGSIHLPIPRWNYGFLKGRHSIKAGWIRVWISRESPSLTSIRSWARTPMPDSSAAAPLRKPSERSCIGKPTISPTFCWGARSQLRAEQSRRNQLRTPAGHMGVPHQDELQRPSDKLTLNLGLRYMSW